MNKVIMSGRLVKEFEIRMTPSGTSVARSSIAVDDGYGENKKTYFFNLVAFGKTAENLEKYSFKGQKILIEGKLQSGSYEKDGVKHSTTDIIIDKSEFLSFKDNNTSGGEKSAKQTEISGFAALDDNEFVPF